ncbi:MULTISPECIES: IS630 family transposase [unclassified Oceanispirochaeta]|uniref:IS630 family transposase n=1 Tax=unclassified Oceanispirochaeta TaxID=2635722 RepID=UPI001E5B8585|nr:MULTISPECIES: IS630 family transposase [unclassified Oceanispirochaeta]
MEDVLNLYERPYNPVEPVVCLDEKPLQLLDHAKPETPIRKPGQAHKIDYEYKRRGTANIFCAVEPKAGRHFAYVSKRKEGKDFAKVLYRIARNYPEAITIHLVMDNYCTHSMKSLTRRYGEEKGKEIWERFTVHFTPKHASWLDQAEIEIGIMNRQCLGGKRFPNIEILRKNVNAWKNRMNKQKVKFDWKFTFKKAKIKFRLDD